MSEINRTGESGLSITINFPEPEIRDEFEAAFQSWYKQFKRQVMMEHLVKGLAEVAAKGQLAAAGGDDVGGYGWQDQMSSVLSLYGYDWSDLSLGGVVPE